MYGLKNVRNRRSDALSRVGWDRLEALLAVYYRDQGYPVEHCGTGAGASRFDGGIDLKLFKGNEYVVVQCKHWNAKQVPHNDVHQLLGIMLNENATGAILVSSGEFTAYARESAAKQGRVQLVDGDALRGMIGPLPELVDEPVASVAGAVAAKVGERLLSAAEDRIRGRGTAGRIAHGVGNAFVFKFVLPFAIACAFAVFAFAFIKRGLQELGQPRAVAVSPAPTTTPGAASGPEPLPAPAAPASTPVTTMPAESDGPRIATSDDYRRTRATDNPCHELIDWRTGTYIDHCAGGAPAQQPSEAEIRESQRKADEAMRVIEANAGDLASPCSISGPFHRPSTRGNP